MIEFFNVSHAFEYLYDQVLRWGRINRNTRELLNRAFTVIGPDPIVHTPWRRFNVEYAEAEWHWYLSGDPNASEIAKKARIWYECMDEHGNVNSNYGYHWFYPVEHRKRQIDFFIEEIYKKSRRAILSHYDYKNLPKYTRDTPCNLAIQAHVDDDKLLFTVYCRSQDLVYGFCNDHYIWRKLQQYICERTGLQQGPITFFIGSLHIYERHYKMRDKWISKKK